MIAFVSGCQLEMHMLLLSLAVVDLVLKFKGVTFKSPVASDSINLAQKKRCLFAVRCTALHFHEGPGCKTVIPGGPV